MSSESEGHYRNQLIIELIADRCRVDTLIERLPGPDIYPPYFLVGAAVFIEYGVFDLYNYFISGKNSFIVEPNSLAVPAMVILGVFGARYIHDTYDTAITRLRLEDRNTSADSEIFDGLLSLRIRIGVWLVFVIITKGFAVFVLGFRNLIAIDGIGLFMYGQIVFPLVYLPVLAEFGLAYFAVHLVIPKRLQRADIGLFFHDPRNMGGFQPVGNLLKRSYYLYTIVLILYFIQTKVPVLLSEYVSTPYESPESPIITLVLTLGWVIGVITIGYSMYSVHEIMKREKEQRIVELESELVSTMKNPFDVREAEVTDADRYEMIQERLQHVRDTRTYPTTFTMWSQIFISALLPQALNLVL